MVKKMVYNWKSWWRLPYRHNRFVIKLGISVLLVGFAFWFLYERSFEFSPVSGTNFFEKGQISASPVVSVSSQENTDRFSQQV
ncbi:hypothetical protein OROGR_010642 [Orobanche gracilis]